MPDFQTVARHRELKFRHPVTVLDVLIEVDPVRSSLHEGIKDFLRNSMVLVNSAVIELDL